MDSISTKVTHRLSAGVLILSCSLALVMPGCNRGPRSQKAPDTKIVSKDKTAAVPPLSPDVQLAKKYVGKYVNKKFPNDFTELKSDGTFVYQEGKTSLTGKYAIQANRLLLALPDGSGSFSKIDDRGLTDDQGNLWSRP